MYIRPAVGAVIGAVLASQAFAGISFSFADPSISRELRHRMGAGTGLAGLIQYDVDANGNPNTTLTPVTFRVDGTDEGFGIVDFNAYLTMHIEVLPNAVQFAGVTVASIEGTFTFSKVSDGEEILTGSFGGGNPGDLFISGAAGGLSGSFAATSLTYTAGSALQALLDIGGPGRFLGGEQDASFTMTGITPAPTVNGMGQISSFRANSSFSGNAEVIPTPGTISLVAASGILVLTGRRRD